MTQHTYYTAEEPFPRAFGIRPNTRPVASEGNRAEVHQARRKSPLSR